MPHPNTPLLDPSNPCYCPSEPASAFLNRLRERDDRSSEPYIPTFARLLEDGGIDEEPLVEGLLGVIDPEAKPDERDAIPARLWVDKKGFLRSANWVDESDSFARHVDEPSVGPLAARPIGVSSPAMGAFSSSLNPFESYASEEEEEEESTSEASTLSTVPTNASNSTPSSGQESFVYFLPPSRIIKLGKAKVKRRAGGHKPEETTFGDLERSSHARSSLGANDESFELPPDKLKVVKYSMRTGHSPGPSSDVYAHAAFIRGGGAAPGPRPRTSSISAGREGARGAKRCADDDGRRRDAVKIRKLEDELYGPQTGTETPRGLRTLVSRLDALLPGIRLRSRLGALGSALSHQAIVDLLGKNGLLNARVLELFRASEVWRLDLTGSLLDELGLNGSGSDAIAVLGKPNSFLCLVDIDLTNVPLSDYDLTSIHHFPLTTLLLNNTGIGNEAIFHLVRLRRTLAYLHVEENPRVTDDAIPALLCLKRLRFLSLIDTGVGMPGLRRFAGTMHEERRKIDVAIPVQCEEYICKIHTHYEPEPAPPLITDPAAAQTLSVGALRRNLAAHSARNAAVLAGGTKAEMAERLERVLTLRREDLVVRAMMWDGDTGVGGEDGEEEEEEIEWPLTEGDGED